MGLGQCLGILSELCGPWLNRLKLSGLSEKFSYPNECGTGTGGEGMRDLLALAIEVAS